MGIDLEGDSYYETWISMVRDALSCMDIENYNWLHLPHGKGYYEQDEFFILVWSYIRYEYIEARRDTKFMENIKNKYKKG
jgi:hypothetical protein